MCPSGTVLEGDACVEPPEDFVAPAAETAAEIAGIGGSLSVDGLADMDGRWNEITEPTVYVPAASRAPRHALPLLPMPRPTPPSRFIKICSDSSATNCPG